MLIVRVNVPLQISRGIFFHGEIIKMHAIHESNYRIKKLPRRPNGNSKGKKINKNNSVYKSYQAQLMGWMHSGA